MHKKKLDIDIWLHQVCFLAVLSKHLRLSPYKGGGGMKSAANCTCSNCEIDFRDSSNWTKIQEDWNAELANTHDAIKEWGMFLIFVPSTFWPSTGIWGRSTKLFLEQIKETAIFHSFLAHYRHNCFWPASTKAARTDTAARWKCGMLPIISESREVVRSFMCCHC